MQYISAAPGATTTWQVTNLTGRSPPAKTYLVQEAAGAGGTADLPTPDATGTINMSGTAGTVALVTSQTALTCKTAADCAADATVKDLVGYGTAVVHEGAADAPAATQHDLGGAQRHGADTDQNGADFTAGDPTPTARRLRSPAAAPRSPGRCASTTSRAPAGSRRTTARA